MEEECIFCNIVARKQHADILYETDQVIVINDILPKAPVHVLVIPKKHIATARDITAADAGLLADMFAAAYKVAEQKGLAERGYKLSVNVGREGGQVVFHLHMHMLGGKQLQ
jgi:histidine triad (HIT) family protein